jgi:hypothetical protein|tara:strand:+ start:52 stop:276 length:225 start_codon:yes stop_codon:yes gene_type:complete
MEEIKKIFNANKVTEKPPFNTLSSVTFLSERVGLVLTPPYITCQGLLAKTFRNLAERMKHKSQFPMLLNQTQTK